MGSLNIKPLILALGISSLAPGAMAGLSTDKAVVDNTGQDRLTAVVKFQEPVSGDLYVATMINNELFFLAENGQLTPDLVPFRKNHDFSTDVTVLDINTNGIPAGQYPLYEVVTKADGDPLNFNDWIGGLGGLNVLNFSVGLSPAESGDLNNDGFADDDANHDGFHDDDRNRDGYHDDDQNLDGYHDGDRDYNGIHDACETADNDNDGGHDSDNDHDGISCTTTTPTTPTSPSSTSTTTPAVNTSAGKTLYDNNCSGCHSGNPAANINKVLNGKNPAAIRSAINANKGGMSFLSNLTDQELQAIADYLSTF